MFRMPSRMKVHGLGWMIIIALVVIIGFILRDLSFIRYGFLYSFDSIGHFGFSKIIIDTGKLWPPSIDTMPFIGYAPWAGFHLLEAIISMITGIKLEDLFLNLVALLSIVTILPIYLAFRRKLESPYQKIALVALSSFWFYFIFGSFGGTYKPLAFFFFALVIYLVESGIERKKSGKLLILVFLTVLSLTHHLTLFATLLYLMIVYLVKGERSMLVYITYIPLSTFIIGHIFDTMNIWYCGLYDFKYKLLIIPILTLILKFIWDRANLETFIKNLLSKIENSRIEGVGIFAFFIFAVFVMKFSNFLSPIHYVFTSHLIYKYLLFLLPLIFIFIFQTLSKTSRFYEELIYVSGITLCFLGASIYLSYYHIVNRSLYYVSPFIIAIIASFSLDKKKLAVIFLISILSVFPAIPSYFYSDSADRPYYQISRDYLTLTEDFPNNTESQDVVLNSLLRVYEKHGNVYLAKMENSKLSLLQEDNLIYQRDLYFKQFNAL